MTFPTSPENARITAERLLKGRQHERVEIDANTYRQLLGDFANIRPEYTERTVKVTRQKLRQVHSQFIARLVAQKLES